MAGLWLVDGAWLRTAAWRRHAAVQPHQLAPTHTPALPQSSVFACRSKPSQTCGWKACPCAKSGSACCSGQGAPSLCGCASSATVRLRLPACQTSGLPSPFILDSNLNNASQGAGRGRSKPSVLARPRAARRPLLAHAAAPGGCPPFWFPFYYSTSCGKSGTKCGMGGWGWKEVYFRPIVSAVDTGLVCAGLLALPPARPCQALPGPAAKPRQALPVQIVVHPPSREPALLPPY